MMKQMVYYKQILETLKVIDLPLVKNNKGVEYYNIECGFDIETTSIIGTKDKTAFMYVWQIGIGYGNPIYYGRTWNEFLDCIEMISEFLGTDENKRLPIYVHNLAYEFQFMRYYFEWKDVFAVSDRKPIRALTGDGIEFRDSYILSGTSLAVTAKNLVKHKIKKMTGDLDYSLTRHHKTPLTPDEELYCINDIQIILAYINEQIEYSGDITLIPMTNTGRVRKYVRDNCYYKNLKGGKAGKGQYTRYRNLIENLTLDKLTYARMKNAFSGGFTHANANYSGKLLENVTSIDFTSSYPSVMLSEKFPMSRFKQLEISNISELRAYGKKYALIMDIKLVGVIAKIHQEHYISESKCYELVNPVVNNGRIAKADELTITVTEIDFDIIEQCYDYDEIYVDNVMYAFKAYLPKAICKSILDLYQSKTELKDVEGSEIEYLLSKGMLNSIYGMCVTDVVKEQTKYNDDGWYVEPINYEEDISKYNESKNRFLYYPWGVWVTAYARRNLWTGILSVGDDYVYSDTDSLKLMNYENHLGYVEWFNENIVEKMTEMCEYYGFNIELLSPKTKDGVTKMLGIWDYEGTYDYFKALGAKRYLSSENGKLALTVAGLSKQNGVKYMLEESDNDVLKVFDMFTDELHIPANRTGKMTHTYIDEPNSVVVTDYLGNTEMVHTLGGVHLSECEFTLSIYEKYMEYLENLMNGFIYKGVKCV